MASIKHKRLETDIRKALAEVLRTDLKNKKNLEFVSITDVELTNDLSFLTIYVHFTDASDTSQETRLEELSKKSSAIRTALARRVHMRKMPQLIFKVDTSFAYASKIDALLAEAKSKDSEFNTDEVTEDDE